MEEWVRYTSTGPLVCCEALGHQVEIQDGLETTNA